MKKDEIDFEFLSMSEKRRFEYSNKKRDEIKPVFGLKDRFVYPHYNDERFNSGEHLLFGEKQSVSQTCYSDRCWQWDYDKASNANEVAQASGFISTQAIYHQIWLSAYEGREVSLKFIYGSVHRGNGQTIYAYGYDFVEESK